MSIKMKILIPMVALTIAAVVATLISNIFQYTGYVDAVMEDRVNTASRVAEKEIEMLKSASSTASLYLAEDSAIVEAVARGDRNAVLTRSIQLQTETGVEFCTITDGKGTVLARSHEPEKYGDAIASQANVKSALSGRSLTAVEQGTAVRLSIRSGSPIYDDQGRRLGVVSVGYRLDTENFVDSIKAVMGCETTIFLGDERISTTVLKEDGTRAVGTKSSAGVSETVLVEGNSYIGQVKVLEHDALTKYTPILGADGKPIGMLFVGRYLTEKSDTVWGFVQIGLLIMLVLLALSTLVIIFLVRRIVAPIHTMVKAAHALAAGDIEVSVQVDTKDEMLELAGAFNNMIENTRQQTQIIKAIAAGDLTVMAGARSDKDVMNHALLSMLQLNNEIFSQIAGSANQVSSGARQIADSSQALAQGATEQAAAVEQLSSTISEVADKTKGNAAMADRAAALADTIKGNAEKGSEQMSRMVQAVKEIGEASQFIGKIIKVIDDIAFQTNILALNAAVEAARAGQHGKGFAVVADEVRNLAAKSAEAAKDTGSLIENSMIKAELGMRIAGETSASLDEIVSGINESGQLVGEIAKSSEQQSAAISQINDGIGQVAQVVQQNSATAEESAAASEEMSGQSDMLQGLIARFKLRDGFGTAGQYPSRSPEAQGARNTAFSLSKAADDKLEKY